MKDAKDLQFKKTIDNFTNKIKTILKIIIKRNKQIKF